MRRLLVCLLALLLPLQSVAAVQGLPVAPAPGCEVGYLSPLEADHCHCGLASHHAGHHSCPHLGALLGLACAQMALLDPSSAQPSAAPASFDSIVLAVLPRPPTIQALNSAVVLQVTDR